MDRGSRISAFLWGEVGAVGRAAIRTRFCLSGPRALMKSARLEVWGSQRTRERTNGCATEPAGPQRDTRGSKTPQTPEEETRESEQKTMKEAQRGHIPIKSLTGPQNL